MKRIMKKTMMAYLIILFSFNQFLYAEEKIILVGSDWCPYICTQKENPNKLAQNPGYIIEIVQYALRDIQISYESPSWKRSLLETRKGTYDAIVGIYTSVAPDFIYPKNELGFSKMCFYVHKDNAWEYKGINSLSKIVLGTIEGYFYDEGEVDAYIAKNLSDNSKIEYIPGEKGIIQNLEKMMLNRISAVIDDYQVVGYTIHRNNLPKAFKRAGCLEGIDVHIGFSPAKPKSKEYADRISSAVKELRTSGELKKILNKYFIKDWK